MQFAGQWKHVLWKKDCIASVECEPVAAVIAVFKIVLIRNRGFPRYRAGADKSSLLPGQAVCFLKLKHL